MLCDNLISVLGSVTSSNKPVRITTQIEVDGSGTDRKKVKWSSCRLRSSYRNRLAVPSVKLSIGSRSFSVSGPTVWNALPDYLIEILLFPLMSSNVI